jgi:hypothetical protein
VVGGCDVVAAGGVSLVVRTAIAIACLALAVLAGAWGAAIASVDRTPPALVTVVRHGGHCVSGTECRTVYRITDTRISAAGFLPRRLAPAERRTLLRAMRALDLAAIRSRPFTGTCPVAYDGQESIYRFRGVSQPLASCTYDLRGVSAVRLTNRLLAALKPR